MVAAYEAHALIEAISAKESSDKAKGTGAPPGSRRARRDASESGE